MSDSTELYYVEMEAARNVAEYEYFEARPYLRRDSEHAQYRALFCAGFERAFAPLWNQLQTLRLERDRLASLGGTLLTQAAARASQETRVGCRHCGSTPLATERGRCEECGKYQTADGQES